MDNKCNKINYARVVELVDTKDLKSFSRQRECGFDSRPGHHHFKGLAGFLSPQFLILVFRWHVRKYAPNCQGGRVNKRNIWHSSVKMPVPLCWHIVEITTADEPSVREARKMTAHSFFRDRAMKVGSRPGDASHFCGAYISFA
jgi:hypothetical protein